MISHKRWHPIVLHPKRIDATPKIDLLPERTLERTGTRAAQMHAGKNMTWTDVYSNEEHHWSITV
jgi:hypothetical protein